MPSSVDASLFKHKCSFVCCYYWKIASICQSGYWQCIFFLIWSIQLYTLDLPFKHFIFTFNNLRFCLLMQVCCADQPCFKLSIYLIASFTLCSSFIFLLSFIFFLISLTLHFPFYFSLFSFLCVCFSFFSSVSVLTFNVSICYFHLISLFIFAAFLIVYLLFISSVLFLLLARAWKCVINFNFKFDDSLSDLIRTSCLFKNQFVSLNFKVKFDVVSYPSMIAFYRGWGFESNFSF